MPDPTLIHRPIPGRRGWTLCAVVGHPYREYPLYHGPYLAHLVPHGRRRGKLKPRTDAGWTTGHGPNCAR